MKIGKTHHEIGLSADEAQVHIQMYHYTLLHTHKYIPMYICTGTYTGLSIVQT